MASQPSQQYACTPPPTFRWLFSDFLTVVRAQKSLGLVSGSPGYEPVAAFDAPDVPARTYVYSADGRFYAYALPTT
jgi:translation initiation factor 2A